MRPASAAAWAAASDCASVSGARSPMTVISSRSTAIVGCPDVEAVGQPAGEPGCGVGGVGDLGLRTARSTAHAAPLATATLVSASFVSATLGAATVGAATVVMAAVTTAAIRATVLGMTALGAAGPAAASAAHARAEITGREWGSHVVLLRSVITLIT